MGLTYGYDIYLRPQNVAGALAALTELAPPDPDGTPLHVTLPGGDRLTLPFTSDFGSAPVDCSGGGTLDLDTTLLFGLDDAVRAYADRPGYAPAADGRLEVGYIYATVRFTSAHHPGYASMEFWAATSAMSRLFERSATVRETFTGLAAAAGGVCCLFDLGDGSPGEVCWLAGESLRAPIGGPRFPDVDTLVAAWPDPGAG
ncbi:hypothetical protein OHS17_02305 [Streptomyces sp. NBC_00523]|uniref:hypothetical protein n=1 Tax=Streptomyces sp. NBC_00523 TaxID=2975765 RepID=UPI002E811CBB|nr:hypothetical protein [Streptomyces sp. NBC_00523]WUC98546.1 hypothetical protein OHS17_02305 [Streptomyces sp. NBC_00523]